MVHGAVIRTFDQEDVEDFSSYSGIPTINALTDKEHPCQILADLLTIQEKLGTWEGKKVVFIGDGNNNMSRSWMWACQIPWLRIRRRSARSPAFLRKTSFDHLDAAQCRSDH
jgi:ornithine carbamoyltransferase